jgi:internalin A
LTLDRASNDDLATLKLCPPLQTFILESPVGTVDLSPLAEVGDIATVNLQRVTAESLAPLASMSTRVLLINHVQGADSMAAIGQMKQLEELRIYGALSAPLSDIGGSSSISALEIAESTIARLDGIEDMPRLTDLVLQTTRDVDLSVLPKLQHVTSLRLYDVGIDALPALPPHLTKLAVGLCHLARPAFRERPAELTSLNLDQDFITDVSGLAPLTTVTELILAQNRDLKNIAPLASLTKLTTLSLYNTGVESLEPLEHVPLENLTLTNAPVKSIAPLEKIPTLRYVHGLMVNITDAEIAELEKANPNLKVSRR